MTYTETLNQAAIRQQNFTHHPPDADQVQRMRKMRDTANFLSQQLNESCPPSRELSLAQTKLEEAVMWANAAIARNED